MLLGEVILRKNKGEKIKKTPKQRFIKFLKVLGVIFAIIAVIAVVTAVVNVVGNKSNSKVIASLSAVEYENQIVPVKDADGYFTYTTDNDLKIVQLTDIHIGGGYMSFKKDKLALNAVAAMLAEEKPDLVMVTGDIAYPVPFQAGTFNNKSGAVLFAELMEKLGVYWSPVFGNHDTELYSYFSRESISDLYESDKYPHCIFVSGNDEVDGYGNYFIKVKNTKGKLTQCLVGLDSHSYVDGDYFGALWKYDTIHENQIEWYESELKRLESENGAEMPKSLAFFHIPVSEFKEAWTEYAQNGYKDTENVKCIYGVVGEKEEGIYPGLYNYGFFDKVKELGSTMGMFCGHDHLNNFSLDYKGVRLTYGYSIDYLAYSGIQGFGAQRGCTVITVKPDGSFESRLENYYQDKYETALEKEAVSMNDMYGE